jgi:hypothetical protein
MRAVFWLCGIAVALVGGAIAMRDWVGLRLAPVRIPHPDIEYLYAPDQQSVRGDTPVRVNAYGMRSDPFPALRSVPDELRVMVFGDSILAAPGLTGQDQLATTLLQRQLTGLLDRPVVVGNVSAGSWGPGNWLAYARTYGFFDADVILLVASGHDHADNPEFLPMHPRPRAVPDFIVPLAEFASQQRLRLLESLARRSAPAAAVGVPAGLPAPEPDPEAVRRALDDLRAFLDLARRHTAQVRVLLHPELPELHGKTHSGRSQIAALAQGLSIPVNLPDARYREASGEGASLYLDVIHPSDEGQALLAQLLQEEVLQSLAQSP